MSNLTLVGISIANSCKPCEHLYNKFLEHHQKHASILTEFLNVLSVCRRLRSSVLRCRGQLRHLEDRSFIAPAHEIKGLVQQILGEVLALRAEMMEMGVAPGPGHRPVLGPGNLWVWPQTGRSHDGVVEVCCTIANGAADKEMKTKETQTEPTEESGPSAGNPPAGNPPAGNAPAGHAAGPGSPPSLGLGLVGQHTGAHPHVAHIRQRLGPDGIMDWYCDRCMKWCCHPDCKRHLFGACPPRQNWSVSGW